MTKITLGFVDELIALDNDRAQFDMIKDLSNDELQDIIAILLGVAKVKKNMIHIVNEELIKP